MIEEVSQQAPILCVKWNYVNQRSNQVSRKYEYVLSKRKCLKLFLLYVNFIKCFLDCVIKFKVP